MKPPPPAGSPWESERAAAGLLIHGLLRAVFFFFSCLDSITPCLLLLHMLLGSLFDDGSIDYLVSSFHLAPRDELGDLGAPVEQIVPNYFYLAIHISEFRRPSVVTGNRLLDASRLPFRPLLLICSLYDGKGGCRCGISWRLFGLIYDGLPSAFMMEMECSSAN